MASVLLSAVGTALGGPVGGIAGSVAGSMIDNILFPGKPATHAALGITTSTYGNPIPLVYGPNNRLGVNMIWSGLIQKDTHKHVYGLAGETTTYHVDAAFAVAAGPIAPNWLKKIWFNGQTVFDAAGAAYPPEPDSNGVTTWDLGTRAFTNLGVFVVYPGNDLQLPDPTIEAALGMGNVPAYRGTAYAMLSGIEISVFGGSIPTIHFLIEAQGTQTIAGVCLDVCNRSGIDPNTASTSALTDKIDGYSIVTQEDGVSALQPLALVYDFDIAEQAGGLRFQARGTPPLCCIENDQLAGHAYGEKQPDAYSWPREPETSLPNMVALTFPDPARDFADNTQSNKRDYGSAESNISTSVRVVLTSDQGRQVCDRMLWEAQIARVSVKARTDDRMTFLETARTYAMETPSGYEPVRITKRMRGANGVIELEARRDYSSLYFSVAPGAAATVPGNNVNIGGPVNPPLFVEPPSTFPGITGPTLFIFLSGGEAGVFNPAWGGAAVYVSTDDVNFTLLGNAVGPATMGQTTFELEAYTGSNPDTIHSFNATTEESGQDVVPVPAGGLFVGTAPTWVGNASGPDGEWISIIDVTDTGANTWHLQNMWRGLFGTAPGDHPSGVSFAQVSSNLFQYPLPAEFVGQTLYFRFVGGGETLATVTSYTYTPSGNGYGTAAGGTPSAPTGVNVTAPVEQPVVTWSPNPPEDNVISYTVSRAPGLSQPFSAASVLGTVASPTDTYPDVTAAASTAYTYFVQASNTIGISGASAGFDITTPA